MEVYAAFRTSPDYHAPPATLHSLHTTLEGAILALYPDRADFREAFTERTNRYGTMRYWEGPDGFGMVKLMEIADPKPRFTVYFVFEVQVEADNALEAEQKAWEHVHNAKTDSLNIGIVQVDGVDA